MISGGKVTESTIIQSLNTLIYQTMVHECIVRPGLQFSYVTLQMLIPIFLYALVMFLYS